eukprot:10712759-Lingulodinium_polyedra.AAC.1
MIDLEGFVAPGDRARLLQRVLIDELALPIIRAGAPAQGHLHQLSLWLHAALSHHDAEDDLPPALQAATHELREVFELLLGLLSPLPVDGIPV